MQELLAHPWMIWAVAALVFGILEVAIPYFCLIFASGGAVVAAIIASQSPTWQGPFIGFAASTLVGLLLLRPQIVRLLRAREHLPSRTDQLLGKRAVVTEQVD